MQSFSNTSKSLMIILAASLAFFIGGCSAEEPVSNLQQNVVITSISPLADLIKEVGGDRIQVVSLVPTGSDPHTYEPKANAVRQVATAKLFFANGVGQESYLENLIANSQNPTIRTVVLADGLPILGVKEEHDAIEEETHTEGDGHDHSQGNPHLWLDVTNAQHYVEKIRDVLIETYPQDREVFTANAQSYLLELESLDQWIKEQIQAIPEEHRQIIVYHNAWAYYTERYGLTVLGSVISGEESEPLPKEYAQLFQLIQDHNVKAIFGEVGFNTKLILQLAQDTGVKVVEDLYNDTLGVTSETDSYIDIMKHNTNAFVSALK
ncbi:ABC-type metal ion transport system, periplasmic component/surface adhesin [Desulfitobacterium dichloroeliminans LMG P-21439]|uniref:ABC-type metal ion transport system, periplasmic component/surface adhesin n=1 Tax=Desulfitobacterium dichloroeliminans (strain LMG P-21439 / DCA1) TaxID=871963 RepID=L0F8L8_DESDL|nr:metal ABC transporter substrate-binding protein [Desulfitobacterium dichloroeliminans]AGA69517.1 ABC-type metal ion transport system, periplasmic component/surface adhesin [Desulfitobacterium dichloroeliminans LMG P-21439]